MPSCYTCETTLQGAWKMTTSFGVGETGRYLGVEGYFFYGTKTNWVYCYCRLCWDKDIIVILPQLNPITSQITALEQQKVGLEAQNNRLQQKRRELVSKIYNLKQQKIEHSNQSTSLQQQNNPYQQKSHLSNSKN